MSKKFGKAALESIIFQGALSVLSFTWIVLLARNSTTSAIGSIMVALAICSSIVIILGVGLQHSISVVAGEHDEPGLVTNAITASFVAGLVAGCAGYIIAVLSEAAKLLDISEGLCGTIVFLQMLLVLMLTTLRSMHKFRVANLISLAQPILLNVFIMAMACLQII